MWCAAGFAVEKELQVSFSPLRRYLGLWLAISSFFTLAASCRLPAQEARWKELNSQVEQLYQENKYSAAIPLAQETLRVAEDTFLPGDPNVATSLNDLAALYLALGRYNEAEPLFKRALAIDEKALGPDDPGLATDLGNLAALYKKQGRYSEAESLYKRSLELRERVLGPEHPDVARSLFILAELYDDQGRKADAEPLYRRALAVREKTFAPDHPAVTQSLNSLAVLYYGQGRYAEAEPFFKRILAIDEETLRPGDQMIAADLNNLSALYHKQGRYSEAEPLDKRALAIREKVLGPDDPDVARSLNSLAALRSYQGRYAEAEPLFKRALAIWEKTLGTDDPMVASSLDNLATVQMKLGHYAEAEPLYKRALAICEKVFGPDHSEVAQPSANLAALYADWGRYAEAEPLEKRALAIREKTLGPNHPDVAQSLNNLGTLYEGQGRYAEAEPLFTRALAIREKALGSDDPDVAMSLNNLARVYDDQGGWVLAAPLLKRALAIDEKALGPEHAEVATVLNSLASVYEQWDNYAEAVPLCQRALAIQEKVFGRNHPNVAQSLNNLAVMYDKQGRYLEEEPLLQRALAIRENAVGPDDPIVATALINLASHFHAEGQPAQAITYFDRAFETLARQFEYYFTYMSEKERLAFLATMQNNLPEYMSLCFSYHEQFPELVGKAYDTVLWQKGFIAQSVAALRAKILAGGDADALRMLEELTSKKGALATLAASPPEADTQKQAARRAQITQLENEANELEKDLVRRSGALADKKQLAHVTWQQVRDALKPDEAAVEIVRFPFYDGKKWTGANEYVALIVRPESKQPQFVVLGEAEELEGDALRDYRRRVGLRANGTARGFEVGTVQNESPDATSKVTFYDAFWKPLEPGLKNIHRVYFSSDGVLNQLALGVVPDNSGQLLMEKYDLRMVSSTKDLLRQTRASTNNTAVVIGNPLFDLDETKQRAAVLALQQTEHDEKTLETADATKAEVVKVASSGPLSRDLRGGALNPLPGTQEEVETVSKLLKGQHWEVAIFTQENALEERVKRIKGPRVLHLATHGFFESDQQWKQKDLAREQGEESGPRLEDPMLRSGLYLTGASRTLEGKAPLAGMDDGVLTAYEATQLNLQGTELVVLSACETGLGESQNGEGVFGLRRALQEAGAETVLMSMWSVPDQETQELMTLFYQKWLGGKEKHEALREAQSELRGSVKARYGRDLAYYWGAFVLVGR